jgi:hypothetical protein
MRITALPKPRRPSVIRWEALSGGPNLTDPAYPTKTASRFPPEGNILGGFLFWGWTATDYDPQILSTYLCYLPDIVHRFMTAAR